LPVLTGIASKLAKYQNGQDYRDQYLTGMDKQAWFLSEQCWRVRYLNGQGKGLVSAWTGLAGLFPEQTRLANLVTKWTCLAGLLPEWAGLAGSVPE
jgi:hypothetical protein